MRGKIVISFRNFEIFLIKLSKIYARRGNFFLKLKNALSPKKSKPISIFLVFGKADDLYFRLVTFLERFTGK